MPLKLTKPIHFNIFIFKKIDLTSETMQIRLWRNKHRRKKEEYYRITQYLFVIPLIIQIYLVLSVFFAVVVAIHYRLFFKRIFFLSLLSSSSVSFLPYSFLFIVVLITIIIIIIQLQLICE